MCDKRTCNTCNLEKELNDSNFRQDKIKNYFNRKCKNCETLERHSKYDPKLSKYNGDGTFTKLKKCDCCLNHKEATVDNFKIISNGFANICNECITDGSYENMQDGFKYCKMCNETKPLERFPFHKDRFYYSATCKDCASEKVRIKRLNSGVPLDRTRTKEKFKVCKKCEVEKPLNNQNFRKKSGLWSNLCMDCLGQDPTRGILKDEYINQKKECVDCKEIKLLVDFRYNKTDDRFSNSCKSCLYKKSRIKFENLPKEVQEERLLDDKIKRLWRSYKYYDAEKMLTFDVTYDYIKECLTKPCIYCGYESTGLDRDDNTKGHTIENTSPCCRECNTTKMNNYTTQEMKILGETIKIIKDSRLKL